MLIFSGVIEDGCNLTVFSVIARCMSVMSALPYQSYMSVIAEVMAVMTEKPVNVSDKGDITKIQKEKICQK